MKPEFLILEITETALLDKNELTSQHISQLCELGCKLALDDFGTGFSSLSHLINFPINIVKLDKSLLPTSETDLKRLAIVEGIATMVNIIGLHIVAEGVETEFQLNTCNNFKVNQLQGYYFSKPLDAANLEKQWLSVS